MKAGRNKNGVSQEKPSVNGWNFLSNDTGYDWFIPDNLDGPTEWFALEFFATTFRVNPGCYLDFQSNESGKVTTWKIVGGKNYAVGEDGTISSSPLSKEYIQSIFRNSRAYRFRPVEGEAMTVKVGRRD